MSDIGTDFDAEAIKFAGTAYLISQRDGITPEEAAVRLGKLLGTPDVVEAAVAEATERKEAVATAVASIDAAVAELKAKLGI